MPLQSRRRRAGRGSGENPPAVHGNHLVGDGEDLFQPMLRQHNGEAQLPVQLLQGGNKVRCGDGVKLARGLIQQQEPGLHDHHRCQVQKLLLAAGQRVGVPVIPVLNAKIAGHFTHPAADVRLRHPQVFQPKGQLVPHLVRDNLLLRILGHKADFSGADSDVQALQRFAAIENPAIFLPVWSQLPLYEPQQRGFPTAGLAAQEGEAPPIQSQGYVIQGLFLCLGVGKAQIFDLE